MQSPKIPLNELDRLQALKSYSILDTLPEEDWDSITKLAAYICQTPISLISLTDEKRQWFKSNFGLPVREIPREYAFCAHAINTPDEPMIVFDLRKDERFADNPLVINAPNAAFYAGIPLVDSQGYVLGTLCAIDNKVRELNEQQLIALKCLSQQVIKLFELRKRNLELERTKKELKITNQNLKQFAEVTAHDIKAPLNNIIGLTNILQESISHENLEDAKNYINYISSSTTNLKALVDKILLYSKDAESLQNNSKLIKLDKLIRGVVDMVNLEKKHQITYPETSIELNINQVAFEQIMLNLLVNSIKYNNKAKVVIKVDFSEDENFYYFSVHDNGVGIAEEDIKKIFDLFHTIKHDNIEQGNGIGLATVKRLIRSQDGDISVGSKVGEGSTFKFSLKKFKN